MRRFLSLLLLLSLLVVPVLAHPGRTDSNGGHYDRSTGQYHYHHGYSAHQHYDMDGDGIPDCPYNFRDATNHSSGSSGSKSTTSPTSATSSELETEYVASSKTTPKKQGMNEDVKFLLEILLFLGIAWGIVFLLWHWGGVI